ncbi:GH92 family glycosyl hydrolase [Desertivirga arenae]|uniref:GH92 family glycosyl hydrolase n=1 Tax=Desertivirga arenae TaxID=2810309 RepID=UPI001A96CA2E|nr:GH92 family glycosyl hydrolase [Pedobacter sp. SYSU D00823]
MFRTIFHIVVAFLYLLSFSKEAKCQDYRFVKYVDPFIGSEGLGNVFVGPSCPYGMVKPGPDVSKASNSGYSPDKDIPLYGFSQVHVSGTGGGPKYGNILLMPFSGKPDQIRQESFRDQEKADAGYYSVFLKDYGIKAELSASEKVAFHRYTYQTDKARLIKIDAGEFLGERPIPDSREAQQFVGSEIEVVSDTEIRGYSRIRGGWNNGAAYTVYFYAITDKPFSEFSTYKNGNLYKGIKAQADDGNKTGVLLSFGQDPTNVIQVKVGISFVSSLKARQNIEAEVPHWNFAKLLSETQGKWEELLKRVELDKSASLEQKKMFYTALYHTMLMPVDRSGENPLWQTVPYYDDFYAIWDTFRSSNPLITLLDPEREVAIVNSLLNIYQRDGYMPDARSGNSNGRTQGGSNAEVLIADAYVKKLKGINYNLGLEAMLKDATVPPGGNEEKEGRGGLTDYNTLGYVSNRFVRAGNRTLEYAYNDYCLAIVAKGLGRNGEYQRFIKQSDNWKNLWRPVTDHGATGFIMPRDPSGKWIDSVQCVESNGRITYVPYTPLAQEWPICVCWWCGFFYEGNSWEYSFYVPHNIAELVKASGGPKAFKERLDTFFKNGYYTVSNEPAFLTPNLYHWVGRPDLSSQRIKQIIKENYNSSPSGLPGNDDSGAMSSWLAFHMIGLFPNAGQSYYLINSPAVKETVLHLPGGKDFKVIAKNLSDKNEFIRQAWLNGKLFNQVWIEHEDIIKGGELVLEMDSQASAWGSRNAPPSLAP